MKDLLGLLLVAVRRSRSCSVEPSIDSQIRHVSGTLSRPSPPLSLPLLSEVLTDARYNCYHSLFALFVTMLLQCVCGVLGVRSPWILLRLLLCSKIGSMIYAECTLDEGNHTLYRIYFVTRFLDISQLGIWLLASTFRNSWNFFFTSSIVIRRRSKSIIFEQKDSRMPAISLTKKWTDRCFTRKKKKEEFVA